MTTISKKKQSPKVKSPAKVSRKDRAEKTPSVPEKPNCILIPIDLIDYSPFNYRVYIDPVELDNLAKGIKSLGRIIHAVTVRIVQKERYELVVGERRVRAGHLAGLSFIPAFVDDLTDEQVVEIQLAENLQRQDAHPMEEAVGIGNYQKVHKTDKEIAARLGKSLSFVRQRVKLLALIPELREIFAAGHFTLTQALEVATLSPEAQQSLFTSYYSDWKEKGVPKTVSLESLLRIYRCDLKNAPFDTKDKDLLPDMKACSHCPHNTATLKSLFPESEAQAHCTNRDCYTRKCIAHLVRAIAAAMLEHKPTALVLDQEPSTNIREAIEQAGLAALPTYEDIHIWPQDAEGKPDPDNYELEDPAGQEEYDHDLADYQHDLELLQRQVAAGTLITGLYIGEDEVRPMIFSPEKRPERHYYGEKPPTSAEVKAAIKANTDTIEMLEGEIARIHSLETKKQEDDTNKVQAAVHTALREQIKAPDVVLSLSEADIAAGRWIIFDRLGDSAPHYFKKAVGWETSGRGFTQSLLVRFHQLTPEQVCLLARLAVLQHQDSKRPGTDAAQLCYLVAQGAGVNTAAIEAEHKAIADQRQFRQESRLAPLRVRLETKKAKAAATAA
ncbi:ParB/RepB/Spo0J family partition protein [Dinghuibacter silviterrae]|uniref:ParB/RepB/Spo0J family partition protein n=1 Tax=Dinghuibacter silviterrae TaxID=1539049 RepID=A0A4R8DHE2_9BACT|nr:ParB/RepB/Spo0J family partition protein [Dinghuibacter silviterrae]TDW97133.1 ParB/RepB/Spo0J family partition protein [Dinghuibacter silviterrae]